MVREEQPEEETVEARRFFRPGCGDSGMAKTFVATFKTYTTGTGRMSNERKASLTFLTVIYA